MYYKNQLGEKIRSLRKAMGETQEELANFLHVSNTQISMYESNRRVPDINTLIKLSEHFMIPIDRLLTDTFSGVNFSDISLSTKKILCLHETILPIAFSEEALTDPHFKKSYEYYQKITNKIRKLDLNMIGILLDRMSDELLKSYNEYGTIETIANILWMVFFQYILIPDKQYTNLDEFFGENISDMSKFFKKFLISNTGETDIAGVKKKEECKVYASCLISETIKLLKRSAKYIDFADYYLALRYCLDLTDNNYSHELNLTIGGAMLSSFLSIGNPYALKTFELFDFDELHKL